MISVKKMGVGLLTVSLLITATLLAQAYDKNVHADNTLTGNNEVISIKTTDGQAPDMPINFREVSGDGNTVLFISKATNLPNSGFDSSNNYSGVYTYNIRGDETTRIDTSESGVLPNSGASSPFISENGRYVYFQSAATNLIDGATRGPELTYMRDLQTRTIGVVSDHYWNGYSERDRPIGGVSNDGRFVLLATRYQGVGYPNFYNVMVGDGSGGSFEWTSVGQTSNITSGIAGGDLSCDGSFVVYEILGGIRLADLRNTDNPSMIFIGNTGVGGTYGGDGQLKISCNGDYIVYRTKNRTDVTPTPPGAGTGFRIVLYNRISGERKYIDKDSSGVFIPAASDILSISNMGDVLIECLGNTYIKHLSDESGTLEPIAKTTSGAYINVATGQMSSNGRYVFFMADPYDLGMATSPEGEQIIRARTNI